MPGGATAQSGRFCHSDAEFTQGVWQKGGRPQSVTERAARGNLWLPRAERRGEEHLHKNVAWAREAYGRAGSSSWSAIRKRRDTPQDRFPS
jgi:hypothetical protein